MRQLSERPATEELGEIVHPAQFIIAHGHRSFVVYGDISALLSDRAIDWQKAASWGPPATPGARR